MSTVAAAILSNALGPASASSDAGSVSLHNPKDVLEVAKYADSGAKATASHRGVLFTKIKAPGAV